MASSAAPRIAILPDAVANQIAAGEVVERPASVVKELVENSIDAGAHHVRVELEQGGKTLIAVSDDGSGMNREDAVLALDRHATSKITSAADLIGVATFGFRGEALPAIASVCRFGLITSDGGDATEISVTGGRLDAVALTARQRGTSITVRALFFNTPARRKFLRSVPSETRAASEAVATLALAHAAVGFELIVDGITRLNVPAGQDQAARLAGVWGPHLAGTLIPVSYASGAVRVEGFAQRPGDAAPTGRRAQLFVNGRPFRDNFLVRAAEAGYRSAIHPGDRPSLLLRLEVDPADVDVNVHPAKLEVRFRDRIAVERVVEEAIRHSLGVLDAAAPVGEWRPMPGGVPRREAGLPPSFFEPLDATEESPEAEAADGRGGGHFSAPVSQLFNTYIVFEGPDALVMVDQHSAHERVLFEEVMQQLSGGAAASQRMLLPETVELTDEELDALEQHRATLEAVGYQVEPFGGRSVVLQSVPAPHRRFDAIACFREMMADLARGRFGGWANRLERFAATYACRAAVKGGTPLGEDEMRALLFRLFETRLAPHDVHGRSTIVQLPREELERRFGRR
ncbi:MAG TPA: DNA mismatch repair endonuclease MutL [Gemmatimonadales bacterium]|nr:DNA mismatch repair endonuclease MutL [Gemmatimonadales bacterium]